MFASKAIRATQSLVPLTRQTLAIRFASQPSGGFDKNQPTAPQIPIEYVELPLAEGTAITVKPVKGLKPNEKKKERKIYDPTKVGRDSNIDKAADKGHEFSEKVIDKARDLKQRAGEKVDEMKDKYMNKTGEEMAHDAKENMHDNYESAKDRASYQAGTATQKAKDMAHDMKESAEEKYENVKNSASYNAGQATQKVKDMAHDAKEKLSDMAGAAKEKVIDAKDAIKEKISEAGKKLKGE